MSIFGIPKSKIRYYPSYDVLRQTRPGARRAIELAACEALQKANVGPDVFYLKFCHRLDQANVFFALSSRLNRKRGTLDIEYDFTSPGMYPGPITYSQAETALKKAFARQHNTTTNDSDK